MGCGPELYRRALSPQAFPDNAARREVESLPAVCPSDGCTWKGTLKEYEVGRPAWPPGPQSSSEPVQCPWKRPRLLPGMGLALCLAPRALSPAGFVVFTHGLPSFEWC